MLLALLIGSALAVPLPDKPVEVTNSGCQIQHVSGPEAGSSWWHLHVWADFKNAPRWIRMFSIRPGEKSMVESAKDCDTFLKALSKARKQKR